MQAATLTVEQALWLLRQAERGSVAAFSVGLGSNGHPAGPDAWVMLTNSRTLWLTPDGSERAA